MELLGMVLHMGLDMVLHMDKQNQLNKALLQDKDMVLLLGNKVE